MATATTDQKRDVRWIDLRKLAFDPENPRLPNRVNASDDEDVIEWMLNDASLLELMAAIGSQDYFPGEPVLVIEAKKPKGHFTVIEGNRRLAATKLLLDPKKAPTRAKSVGEIASNSRFHPTALPAIEFSSRDDIVGYLGYRHVTGVKQWDPLAKARYLRQLAGKGPPNKERYQDLAKRIGSKWDYVARLLTGLALYDRIERAGFFEEEGLDEGEVTFSLLTTALSYEKITRFLGLKGGDTDATLKGVNDDHLRQLFVWLFKKEGDAEKPRVSESRKLRLLAAVVHNRRALKAFQSGRPLDEAANMTDEPSKVFAKEVGEARRRLEIAQAHVHLVDEFAPSDGEVLAEVVKLGQFLAKAVASHKA